MHRVPAAASANSLERLWPLGRTLGARFEPQAGTRPSRALLRGQFKALKAPDPT